MGGDERTERILGTVPYQYDHLPVCHPGAYRVGLRPARVPAEPPGPPFRRYATVTALGLLFALLVMATLPLLTSGTRDAREFEAEMMLTRLTADAEAFQRRDGSLKPALTAMGVARAEFDGTYYTVDDALYRDEVGYYLIARPRHKGDRTARGYLYRTQLHWSTP